MGALASAVMRTRAAVLVFLLPRRIQIRVSMRECLRITIRIFIRIRLQQVFLLLFTLCLYCISIASSRSLVAIALLLFDTAGLRLVRTTSRSAVVRRRPRLVPVARVRRRNGRSRSLCRARLSVLTPPGRRWRER